MSNPPRHCPFLNRNDTRCAGHFQVRHLEQAFRYCFDHYKACPIYLELLVERRLRRMTESVVHASSLVQITVSTPARASSDSRAA